MALIGATTLIRYVIHANAAAEEAIDGVLSEVTCVYVLRTYT
jgi:hypothetical protein